jgi:DNA topoisomerase-6 subunit B
MSGIAQKLASNQKQVAISEFFEKNKHFLGFDSPVRSLITAVKEAVDNSLDACEEARILPSIKVKVSKIDTKKDIIELVCEDNGPGIPQKSIEKVFGQLLFGSRFHAIRQSRGQQGIGITGVVMYSQLTTGKPTHVKSKIATESTAAVVDIGLDTRKNKATKSNSGREIWLLDDGEMKKARIGSYNPNESKISERTSKCLAVFTNDKYCQSSC